jgi:hypothetical protein
MGPRGRFYTQNRLAEEAFSDLQTESDRELTQLGAIKMILMEQVQGTGVGGGGGRVYKGA